MNRGESVFFHVNFGFETKPSKKICNTQNEKILNVLTIIWILEYLTNNLIDFFFPRGNFEANGKNSYFISSSNEADFCDRKYNKKYKIKWPNWIKIRCTSRKLIFMENKCNTHDYCTVNFEKSKSSNISHVDCIDTKIWRFTRLCKFTRWPLRIHLHND